MNEELYFNDELRKCLNAAGLSDCGENDAWNYWYHRVHKAHDQAVDRVTEAQRAENAKLRELVKKLVILAFARCADCDLLDASCALVPTQKCLLWNECESIARELGVEVDDG